MYKMYFNALLGNKCVKARVTIDIFNIKRLDDSFNNEPSIYKEPSHRRRSTISNRKKQRLLLQYVKPLVDALGDAIHS